MLLLFVIVRLLTLSSGFGLAGWAGSLAFLLLLGCAGGDGANDGLGGAGGGGEPTDERYEIDDVDEDCDGVEGLRASAILSASGLEFEGTFSWTDLETGYEASRSMIQVEATIGEDGVTTCIPFRHYPGQAPEYARLSYDDATLSMVTDDGVLDEAGAATVWLSETSNPGVFKLEIVRAFAAADAEGTFESSATLDADYDQLVLVYEPSETRALGHVSVAREAATDVMSDGDTAAGVPHGYFPAIGD